MLHGLLVPGPEALTVDIQVSGTLRRAWCSVMWLIESQRQGDAGPMRFYAGIDDACNITLADHPERIETLEELVLLCVEPGRQIRKEVTCLLRTKVYFVELTLHSGIRI